MAPKSKRRSGAVHLVAASYVLLRKGNTVLLQLRRGTGYLDGHWALLAGHVETGESAHGAAVREAREESGVRIEPPDLVPLATLHRFQIDGPAVEQRCDFFFATEVWEGDPTIREPDRAGDMQWFGLDRLPEPVVPHERAVLDLLRDGRLPAILCWEQAEADGS
ncbi:NUDIX domain-containing protein [Actinotalea sp.]|uniref:NUDIX hydrolase n=1 Tax=Actinotalea sp. TaxID=1872145 RepID=UPI002C2BC645|nr:NUDIX domain-containing protein [Actinotalea sp.]HQY32582.1 NUDIX domain-containing protein [Actinotalea sp.]HRA49949.1 NUDIX domain-containing protein [Actinotalea sp.]